MALKELAGANNQLMRTLSNGVFTLGNQTGTQVGNPVANIGVGGTPKMVGAY